MSPNKVETSPVTKLFGTATRTLITVGSFVTLVTLTSLAALYFQQQYRITHEVQPASATDVSKAVSMSNAMSAYSTAMAAQKYDDAIKALTDYVSANGSAPVADLYAAQINLGAAYMAKKDYAGALKAYQAAEKLSGTAKYPEAIGAANAAEQLAGLGSNPKPADSAANAKLALDYYAKAKALTTDAQALSQIDSHVSVITKATK